MRDGAGLLLCTVYRTLRQSPRPIQFLTDNMDGLLMRHRCLQVLIVGDLNNHLERDAYMSLLTVQGLTNYVSFPTRRAGRVA